MVDFRNEGPREQHNYGSGPFIGRDNHGDIRIETLDPKSKTVLAKLSTDAPALAKLLTRALRDGIISPNVVAALESAVRNINEDVAYSLRLAGENINEDVAYSLRLAGQNINKDVAGNILQAAGILHEATREHNHALSSLNETAAKVSDLQGGSHLGHLVGLAGTITNAAERIERVVAPPPPRGVGNWKAAFKVFFWGAGAGFLAGALLTYQLIKR